MRSRHLGPALSRSSGPVRLEPRARDDIVAAHREDPDIDSRPGAPPRFPEQGDGWALVPGLRRLSRLCGLFEFLLGELTDEFENTLERFTHLFSVRRLRRSSNGQVRGLVRLP